MKRADILAERNGARPLYLWSLFLPLILIPLVCLGPLVLLLPLVYVYLLFSGFFSRLAFVRWHTAQWALWSLIGGAAVIVGVIAIAMIEGGQRPWPVMCLGSLVLGGGWWLVNLVGVWQANRGDCWLWSLWSPSAPLPRPWHESPDTPASLNYEDLLLQGRAFSLYSHRRSEAINCFLQVFRAGPSALRPQAVRELEKLGEVEVF